MGGGALNSGILPEARVLGVPYHRENVYIPKGPPNPTSYNSVQDFSLRWQDKDLK